MKSLLLVAAACFIVTVSVADIKTPESFCQKAQQIVANTDVLSDNTLHTDFKQFVKSKAFESPLQTQQYVDNILPSGEQAAIPVTVSCKLKTAERINYAASLANASLSTLPAKGESNCQAVNQYSFETVLSHFDAHAQARARAQFVIDEDAVKWIGPLWIRPWPYQIAYTDGEGKIHIRSKSLYVEHSIFIPMPDSFKGTHYCHLIAWEYLAALVSEQQQAPALLTD